MASVSLSSKITIEGEDYDLTEIPKDSSAVVVKSTNEMEDLLVMQPIVDQLNSLGIFMRVAYASVVGHTDLQIKVREVYHKVAELCDQSCIASNRFQQSATSAVNYLQITYRYFMEGHFKAGIKTLKYVGRLAAKLSEQAKKLEDECNNDAKEVKNVGKQTLEKRGKIMEEKAKSEEKRKCIEEKVKVERGKQSMIESEILESKERYDKAETNHIEQRNKWQFENHKSLGFLKTLANAMTRKLSGDDAYGSGHVVREAKEERDKYAVELQDLKKERRKILEKIAKFAVGLQACESTGRNLNDSAIIALNQALKALEHIGKTFSSFRIFWKNVEGICEDLVNQEQLLETMPDNDDGNFTTLLQSDTFRTQAIQYYGMWIGVKKISVDLRKNIEKTQRNVWDQLVECPSESEAKKVVKSLAKDLEADSRKSIEELDCA